ncbi:hypothetical protein A5757_19240 [Mycobacterium sp. 852013-51886_SCH5428379]|uniref:hypothetical protein n=1 Tax=Mycobacterium sp. 852013-51886_SCH5428379 TaxID=1834111 RepID=UPI000801243E|nr:hypothetical protein [Mycobacterium sp. 852013-51886_SCH5428379]OBB57952.1 hypothetical protein A5757_19240 [Mycobacterium sp. 852013-51886_SCH5428379]
MTGYIKPSDYAASPRSTDPAVLLREERIRSRYLREQLDAADNEIAARERLVNQMYAEAAASAQPATPGPSR